MIKNKMALNNVIGSLSKALNAGEFKWLINLSDEILETKGYLYSPIFLFAHASWYVRIQLNGYESEEYISLFLCKEDTESEINVQYSLEMILNGMVLAINEGNSIFGEDVPSWGWLEYVLRSKVLDLWSKKTEDCSQLTIKIRMSKNDPPKEDTSLEKKMEGMKILCQNIKDLLHDEKGHDLILKVKDREFKVHQNIMQCRCPVFKSMLHHDTLEKNRGIVEIDDCDPIPFEQFIFYVYSGDLETLDESFMLGLYYIADKYEMAYLKEMCCEFIKKALSPRNVCDVIKLALNHSDSALLECGKKYYIVNVKKVLVTVEWQSFLMENPIEANELFIKTIDHCEPEDKCAEYVQPGYLVSGDILAIWGNFCRKIYKMISFNLKQ